MKKIIRLNFLILLLCFSSKNLAAQIFSFEHNGTNQMVFSESASTQLSIIANKAYYNYQLGFSPIKHLSISIAYSKYKDIKEIGKIKSQTNSKGFTGSLGWYYDFNRRSRLFQKRGHWHEQGSTIGFQIGFQRNYISTLFLKPTMAGYPPILNLKYNKLFLLFNYHYRYKYGQFNFSFILSQLAYQSIVLNGNREAFPYSFNLSIIPEYNPFKTFAINIEKQFGLKSLRFLVGLNLNFAISKRAAVVVDTLGYSYLGMVVDLKHLGIFSKQKRKKY